MNKRFSSLWVTCIQKVNLRANLTFIVKYEWVNCVITMREEQGGHLRARKQQKRAKCGQCLKFGDHTWSFSGTKTNGKQEGTAEQILRRTHKLPSLSLYPNTFLKGPNNTKVGEMANKILPLTNYAICKFGTHSWICFELLVRKNWIYKHPKIWLTWFLSKYYC